MVDVHSHSPKMATSIRKRELTSIRIKSRLFSCDTPTRSAIEIAGSDQKPDNPLQHLCEHRSQSPFSCVYSVIICRIRTLHRRRQRFGFRLYTSHFFGGFGFVVCRCWLAWVPLAVRLFLLPALPPLLTTRAPINVLNTGWFPDGVPHARFQNLQRRQVSILEIPYDARKSTVRPRRPWT